MMMNGVESEQSIEFLIQKWKRTRKRKRKKGINILGIKYIRLGNFLHACPLNLERKKKTMNSEIIEWFLLFTDDERQGSRTHQYYIHIKKTNWSTEKNLWIGIHEYRGGKNDIMIELIASTESIIITIILILIVIIGSNQFRFEIKSKEDERKVIASNIVFCSILILFYLLMFGTHIGRHFSAICVTWNKLLLHQAIR